MKQVEIDYFWPLTEQIPLELDYSTCSKPVVTVSTAISQYSLHLNGASPAWTTTSLVLDADTTMIKVKEKPNWIRKVVYNMIGLRLITFGR